MPDDLCHDFATRALRHRLLHEISKFINEQPIAPEDLYSLWLRDEMRLVRQYDRCQPIGFGEGDKPSFSWDIACQVPDKFEKRVIVKRARKRHPLGLFNVIGKVGRIPELCPTGSDLLPKSP